MKYNISDNRLKAIIDELGEEYKDLLIEYVLDDTNEIDTDQINLSELIRLDVSTKSNLRNSKKVRRQTLLHSTISLFGITYALLGFVFMMASEFINSIRYNSTMMISIVLIFMGLFVTLFSLLFKSMMKVRSQYSMRQQQNISRYEIINKWKEIEALMCELTPKHGNYSLSSMIRNLKDTRIISEQDIDVINNILNIRNRIVHNQDFASTQVELRKLLSEADKIIYKMKKLI